MKWFVGKAIKITLTMGLLLVIFYMMKLGFESKSANDARKLKFFRACIVSYSEDRCFTFWKYERLDIVNWEK